MISEEMHKQEAKKLRLYAEAQIEKERARRMNQKLGIDQGKRQQRRYQQKRGRMIKNS